MARSCEGEGASAEAPRVGVVDTVGAGDSLVAGFLHAYLAGASLQVCSSVHFTCVPAMMAMPAFQKGSLEGIGIALQALVIWDTRAYGDGLLWSQKARHTPEEWLSFPYAALSARLGT